KITTYRKLAEAAIAQLKPYFPAMGQPWTGNAPLPGGDIDSIGYQQWVTEISQVYPWMPTTMLQRLTNAYGTRIHHVIRGADDLAELGECFGKDLYAAEVDYLISEEWARSADDIVWRRSKLGLYLNA